MTTADHNSGGDVDLLGELAHRRRQVVQEESARPNPDFLESIEGSRASYYFRPVALPLAQVDVPLLLRLVEESYGSILSSPDRGLLHSLVSREELFSASDEEALKLILRLTDRKQFALTGGKFPLQLRTDFVPIRSIVVNYECVSVEVAQGSTPVAAKIVEEVYQMLCISAGTNKRSDEIALLPTLIRYSTSTRVSLPFPAEHLMSERLSTFINDHIIGGETFAGRTRSMSRKNNFDAPDVASVVTFDDLIITISTFDLRTGSGESHDIRFSVTSIDDHGMANIRIDSPFSFDDHIRLIELMVAKFIS
ncbi:hypothetical protein [Pseudonocardia sp. TRM90224]|uniref:hypothetical protein n=1 Tax=Pseudonocardia sp. TRM90224 TaxID=2812678 RepID=UPI001E63DEEC|nr:hypothetical protein [Pseudonocardia sp. TRM90224]